jgi:glutathione S-transferase
MMAHYVVLGSPHAGDTYKVALMLGLAGHSWRLAPETADFCGPVLLAGDQSVREAGAILDFLAEETRRFGPKSDDERRQIMRWMLFDARCFGCLMSDRGELSVSPITAQALAMADQHLAEHPFLIGRRLTIADIALGGTLLAAAAKGLSLAALVHVENWLDRIRAQPGWKGPEVVAKA